MMANLNSVWGGLAAWERAYDGEAWVQWHQNHLEIPVYIISMYVAFLFNVPGMIENRPPFELKTAFAVWNLFLSVFSCVGASRVVPMLYAGVMDPTKGFSYTVCADPIWYRHGPTGLWIAIFIYSKIPELMDTVFLVLRKKKIIFLHWFHHLTVLMYCWHAFHVLIGPGIWFAAMNYCVHSIMYFYYFMTNIGYYKLVAPIAPAITTIQILQMVGGIVVLIHAAMVGEGCHVDAANLKLGLSMYGTYFVLFAMLFYSKYFGEDNKAKKADRPGKEKELKASSSSRSKGKVKNKNQNQSHQPSIATRFLDPECDFKTLDLVGHFTYMDDQNGFQIRPRAKSE